jgi:hypothetical protein
MGEKMNKSDIFCYLLSVVCAIVGGCMITYGHMLTNGIYISNENLTMPFEIGEDLDGKKMYAIIKQSSEAEYKAAVKYRKMIEEIYGEDND